MACAWPKSASPARTEQLHVTLHFLGNFPRARMPELVAGIGLRFKPFELEFGHSELWHGGIAVLAPDTVPVPLLALHGALGEALEKLGLPLEARPVPSARDAGAPRRPHIGADPGPADPLASRWLRADGIEGRRRGGIRRRKSLPG